MKKTGMLIALLLVAVGFVYCQTNTIDIDAAGNVRIDTPIETGYVQINTPNLTVSGVQYASLPRGAIIMWSGATVPDGWILCDGSDFTDSDNFVIHTPNLRGRFIVGFDADDEDYKKIGKMGGEKAHTLTVNEMPSHNHDISTDGGHTHGYPVYYSMWADNEGGDYDGASLPDEEGRAPDGITSYAGSHTHTIYNRGGSSAHENRPPYYTLAYIMKIKGKGPNTPLPH